MEIVFFAASLQSINDRLRYLLLLFVSISFCALDGVFDII